MSKLNAFRAVNLNYNSDSMRIEDETFYFNGESTLMSLANGGGKSVLVQMIMALFVHKRYRDTTDRPFSTYFNTSKPTFLMIEWKLDREAGYVLTGMMVRRRQSGAYEDETDALEMVNFVHEYTSANDYDIESFPVVEKDDSGKKLRGFNVCRQMLEGLKKQNPREFGCYDMSQSIQQKQYFVRLREYGINYEEWETIIKKINIKESGLSELFKDAKDEAGLVEKWFLPTVERRLNKEKNEIKSFQELMLQNVRQHKENQSKLERRATILEFRDDAQLIGDRAQESCEIIEAERKSAGRIGCLHNTVDRLRVQSEELLAEKQQAVTDKERELLRIRREELSYELYRQQDKLAILQGERESILAKRLQNQGQKDELAHQLHIQECASAYEDYRSASSDLQVNENKLELTRKKEGELKPERDRLGYTLRLHYERECGRVADELASCTDKLDECGNRRCEAEDNIAELHTEQRSISSKIGEVSTRINNYAKAEARFNSSYGMSLSRNILSTYEEGTFELLIDELEKSLQKIRAEIREQSRELMELERQNESINRDLQDGSSSLGRENQKLRELEERLSSYDAEVERRISYMRYLSLPENKKFEKPFILEAFSEKIAGLETDRDGVRRELDSLRDEHRKLKTGIMLDLPEELKELLEGLDINYLPGMEWLKNVKMKADAKLELVKKNPFLPYSLIIGNSDIERLAKQEISFFTPYPICIVRREKLLEYSFRAENGISNSGDINFFVAFNSHLLNEEELKTILEAKQSAIDAKLGVISRKSDEIQHYQHMYSEIEFQRVDSDTYKAVCEDISKCRSLIDEYNVELAKLRDRKSGNETRQRELRESLETDGEEEKKSVKALQDITALQEEYKEYLADMAERETLYDKLAESERRSLENKAIIDKLNNELQMHERKRTDLRLLQSTLGPRAARYRGFAENEIIDRDIEDVEARYEAISSRISDDIAQLEEWLEKCRERFERSQQKLVDITERYKIIEEEYRQLVYDRHAEERLRVQVAEADISISKISGELVDCEHSIGMCEHDIKHTKDRLREEFDSSEPVPREEIINLEFKRQIKFIRRLKAELELEVKQLNKKIGSYQSILSGLSEYSAYIEEYDFAEELALLNKRAVAELSFEELSEMQGVMIRQYRQYGNRHTQSVRELERLIEKIIMKPCYTDEYFMRPLDTMKGLAQTPTVLQEQLDIVKKSFYTQLEKLEIDIALLDREKEKLAEMLQDYVEKLHKDMAVIDRNSTITVNGRQLKMLRINVPSWEDNVQIYARRLYAFMEDLIKRGLDRMEVNGNMEELMSVSLTGKNLYDAVVGIGSVSIKLYKIEAQREYPITWAEVSKNSGGEGFLSAFIILSSLMSYMRRDLTDIFGEREDGKVLIMDNPFAQTNAAHLLKPMMDIAMKSNTQLICFTGLRDESINNRFENIYVLNLVESRLNRGLQYISAEHVKGDIKLYNMTSSRLKIEDSQQLELEGLLF